MKYVVYLLVIFGISCSHNVNNIIPVKVENKYDWKYQYSDTLNAHVITFDKPAYISPTIKITTKEKCVIVDSSNIIFITDQINSNSIVLEFDISSFQKFNNDDVAIFPEYYLKIHDSNAVLLKCIQLEPSVHNKKYYTVSVSGILSQSLKFTFIRYTYLKYRSINTMLYPITIENLKIRENL